jgi:hypothetical protein
MLFSFFQYRPGKSWLHFRSSRMEEIWTLLVFPLGALLFLIALVEWLMPSLTLAYEGVLKVCFFAILASGVLLFAVTTQLFDSLFIAFTLPFLLVALYIESIGFGSGMNVPGTNALSRALFGLLLTIRMDISAEVTPSGEWTVVQFPRNFGDSFLENRCMSHGIYDDPRVINKLVLSVADLFVRQQLRSPRVRPSDV